jgi:hypothetical protein
MTEHRVSLSKLAAALQDGSHSIFSPSGSAMWTHCSGSLIPNLLQPDSAGIDAATGTVAHGIGELWLKTKVKPRHLIGTIEKVVEEDGTVFEIEITEVMLDFVQVYFDWCSLLPGDHFVETRVFFSDLVPIEKQGGTADHAACSPGHLVVTDLKFGIGEVVYARDNTQAILYAYGFFREWDWWYDFQEIEIRICQPRLDHLDTWTISRAELLKRVAWISERAHAAWQIDAPRAASEKACRWCKVKADCGAFAVMNASLHEGAFEDLTAIVPVERIDQLKRDLDRGHFADMLTTQTLTNAQIGVLLGYRKAAETWWNAVALEASLRSARGITIPGYKLVEGRVKRRFANAAVAGPKLVALGCDPADVYVESMVSPAQAEDLLVKAGHRRKDLPDLIDGLTVKPPGKPTLAPISDRRPVLEDVSEGAFADLTNPETEEY